MGTIQAALIMQEAAALLSDRDGVRWLPVDLLDYLNAGQREIATHKPSACTETVRVELQVGTMQVIAAPWIRAHRFNRNLTNADGDPHDGGRAITVIERHLLDVSLPDWSNPNVVPYTSEVTHVVIEPSDPSVFYVVPDNDGTGVIEAVMLVQPADVTIPSGNVTLIASYTDTINVPDDYREALVCYIQYKAHSRDGGNPNAANLAMAHYQKFLNLLGVKATMEQQGSALAVQQAQGG